MPHPELGTCFAQEEALNELLPFGEYIPPEQLASPPQFMMGLDAWELDRLLTRLALHNTGAGRRSRASRHRHGSSSSSAAANGAASSSSRQRREGGREGDDRCAWLQAESRFLPACQGSQCLLLDARGLLDPLAALGWAAAVSMTTAWVHARRGSAGDAEESAEAPETSGGIATGHDGEAALEHTHPSSWPPAFERQRHFDQVPALLPGLFRSCCIRHHHGTMMA